jgi:capsular exopolysaccharide synthesis family protein
MDPIEYLKVLRRRWPVIVVSVFLAATVGVFIPTGMGAAEPTTTQYKATTILLTDEAVARDPRIGGASLLATLTTIGKVPKRAAQALNFTGEPRELASTVRASNGAEGLLRISATASEPDRAELVADTFADELMAYVEERSEREARREAREFRERIREIQAEIQAIDQEILSAPAADAGRLGERRADKSQEAQGLVTAFQQSASSVPVGSGMEVLQPAEAQPVATTASDQGLELPSSVVVRVVIGALVGLLAGVGIAFFLGRLDRRIYTKEVAELSFQAPVLAEIPRVSKKERASILRFSSPESRGAEAFRLLGLSLASGLPGSVPQPSGNGSEKSGATRTILVTSPGPDEGKSTVVANVAASLAEIGKRVLVISCDFRGPAVHRLLGVQDGEGLDQALLSANGGPVLSGYIRKTDVEGISLVPTNPGVSQPIELLTSSNMRLALDEARQSADVVLLDTPPLLMVSDAANLIAQADAVLLVARAQMTTTETAKRTRELLRRLRAPAVGVALNATTGRPTGYGGFRWSRMSRGFPPLARH